MSGRGKKSRRRFTVDSLFEDTSPRAAGVRDLVEAKEIRSGQGPLPGWLYWWF